MTRRNHCDGTNHQARGKLATPLHILLLYLIAQVQQSVYGFSVSFFQSNPKTSSYQREIFYSSNVLLLAGGGFGAGKTSNKKKKKSKQQRKGLQGISQKEVKSTAATTAPQPAAAPKLDKWGLAPPTIEDLFPLMPPGTELIPSRSEKPSYTLQDITSCLKDHIDLKFDRCFDENCVEKATTTTSTTRPPMKLKLLHESPPVLAIENFFSNDECMKINDATTTAHEVDSATFKGALSTRTSTSWFCNFVDVPILLAKANSVLNIPLETMEEPQIVRYRKGQEFSWHYDEVPAPQLQNGKQRVATLLVYLNDIPSDCGGGTTFRDLTSSNDNDGEPLVMQPKCGSALLFFPAFRDGRPDDRTLHKSEVMTCDDEKWIVQMWVHEKNYQAVLPVGNSNEAARTVMEKTQQELGYIK